MWVYNKQKNDIREEPTMLKPDLKYYDDDAGGLYNIACAKYVTHLETLRTLPVSGNHLWEDGKRVEEGKDFEIRQEEIVPKVVWEKEYPDKKSVAVPLSPVEETKPLKNLLVVKNEEGEFHIWSKEAYNLYIDSCVKHGAGPAFLVVTTFNEDDNYLFPTNGY